MAIVNNSATPHPAYQLGSVLDAFPGEGRKLLKPKKHDLPFIAYGRRLPAADNWDVPATGGFIGGEATGNACALMYLKRLRDQLLNGRRVDILLAEILESLMIRFEEEGGKAMLDMGRICGSESFTSVEAQMTGFVDEISEMVNAAVQGEMGAKLDPMSYDDLLAQANKGLNFDQQAYISEARDAEALQRYIEFSSQGFRGA